MKSVSEYRADLFVLASEFKTEDAEELARIDTLIQWAIDKYSRSHPSHADFDQIIILHVAAQLRKSQLNAANSKGYSSVRSGSESVTFYSASSKDGNSYADDLKELLGGESGGLRQFANYTGGTQA